MLIPAPKFGPKLPPMPPQVQSALGKQDVVWTSPSADAAGSMPIGNGEVVLNVWVEKGTGDVMILIGRTDSLSEISRVLKLGRVRVSLSPNPFKDAPDFAQHLVLKDGRIDLKGSGEAIRLFVDTSSNVIHLRGEFAQARKVTAQLEIWRDSERTLPEAEMGSAWSAQHAPVPLKESADWILSNETSVRWAHRNETSIVPRLWEEQTLNGLSGRWDPLINRTFGGTIAGKGFRKVQPKAVEANQVKNLDLKIATYTAQVPSLEEWNQGVEREAKRSPSGLAERRTQLWWSGFWNRSWVFVGNDPKVTQGNVLQRYVQACQGRGELPIKFNGGYYCVEPTAMGKPFNPDWRQWGDSHWFQNVRFTVHPMLAQGDYEQMEPFFRLYERALPLAMARAKFYHGAEGAYFPETMTPFGTYAGNDYGWNRKGLEPKDVQCDWWKNAWNQGPELVALMLDRYENTMDTAFLRKRVLPMAEQVLKYFDTRFRKGAEGKIVLDPTQVVETYWTGVVNDAPAVGGLIAISERLNALPQGLVDARRRALFSRMQKACPDLPIEMNEGKPELAPAQKYDTVRSNVENGELYPVFPFHLVSLGKPKLLEEAIRAYEHRGSHLDNGWGYDGNIAALLGMTDEAKRILVGKVANSHPAFRWPATWGPNYDWLPDQNHGGNLLLTTQLMLMQADPISQGGQIRLLPAWPKDWDANFQLHAPGNTVVRCEVKSGKVVSLDVFPPERKKDVKISSGW